MKKRCGTCLKAKPLRDFYRSRVQVLSDCKPCHNAKCAARVRSNPKRRKQQYQAKRRWCLRNPERKRLHEGRLIFSTPALPILHECEAVLNRFNELIHRMSHRPARASRLNTQRP